MAHRCQALDTAYAPFGNCEPFNHFLHSPSPPSRRPTGDRSAPAGRRSAGSLRTKIRTAGRGRAWAASIGCVSSCRDEPGACWSEHEPRDSGHLWNKRFSHRHSFHAQLRRRKFARPFGIPRAFLRRLGLGRDLLRERTDFLVLWYRSCLELLARIAIMKRSASGDQADGLTCSHDEASRRAGCRRSARPVVCPEKAGMFSRR